MQVSQRKGNSIDPKMLVNLVLGSFQKASLVSGDPHIPRGPDNIPTAGSPHKVQTALDRASALVL